MSTASLRNAAGITGATAALVKGMDQVITACAITLGLVTLISMFLALMAEVVVRYATNQGMGWPSELPSLLFPWFVMSGIVLAAQRGQHIAVTALLSMLGRTAARMLLLALQALLAVAFFYLAWVGMEVIEITGTEVYPVTGVSAHWAYLALIVGFTALGITALTTFVHLLAAADPHDVRKHEEEL